jgi:peptide/nickel transport system substrate-binding protein/oligopeptide transport system substrate-binding protein
MALAACGGDDSDGEATGEVTTGGEFTIQQCEPQNLMTGNSSEVCGSSVLEQLYDGLTQVDYESGEVVGLVATHWETEDAVTWTFHLRDDYTFHNGEPVTAQTFVDTWNWVVDPDNAQQNENFMARFEGYQEVVDGEADTMSGVEAIDDYTLQITLTEPFSPLPSQLTYTGTYPLPAEAFDDIEAFQEAPIGNGRYMMDGVWEHDEQIAMVRYEDWPGDNPGLADRIVWRIYDDVQTAYLDVQAGNLDILSGIPPENIPGVENDFGDNVVESESSSFTYMGMPMYMEEFENPDVRHALSMAIDRESIITAIFNDARVPATAVIPPVLAQHRGDACNYCHYDPEAAADLYEAAGGPEEFEVWFNGGAGHEAWVEAVTNNWRDNLGIEVTQFNDPEFADYLDIADDEGLTGPFRLGWVLSYPNPQYAMEPIYTTGQSSNYTGYSSEEFDNLIGQANQTPDLAEADVLYQQAEDVLLEDMPILPLWYETRHTVHTDNVSNVNVDPRTFVRVEAVQVNS